MARGVVRPAEFGGCDGKIENCLLITEGCNYTVRLLFQQNALNLGRAKAAPLQMRRELTAASVLRTL